MGSITGRLLWMENLDASILPLPDGSGNEDTTNRERSATSLRTKLITLSIKTFCKYAEDLFNNDLAHVELQSNKVDSLRPSEPIIKLLHHLSKSIRTQGGEFELIVRRLDDLRSLATEKFYAYPFKDVPNCWRDIFRSASLLKFTALASRECWGELNSSTPASSESQLDEMVKTMDMTLIMVGKPRQPEIVGEVIDATLELLQQTHETITGNTHPDDLQTPKRRRVDSSRHLWEDSFTSKTTFVPSVSRPVEKFDEIDFVAFENHMLNPKDQALGPKPIVIPGRLEHWPARNENPWGSPSYLLSKTIGGRRLVPIELGRSYVDEGWGQKIISFKDFVNEYIYRRSSPSGSSTGYLAQHDLFAQMPSLRNDISIPDFCYTSPPPPHYSSPLCQKHAALPKLDEPLLNAWFGPADTISPLHTDPYHNILAQVVGQKYVRLYAPRESEKIYPRGIEEGGIDMENTSSVDVGVFEGWDGSEEDRMLAFEAFPQFQNAQYVDCILEEGDCLYIPLGWWHYVRSLSVSFSVSFWFN